MDIDTSSREHILPASSHPLAPEKAYELADWPQDKLFKLLNSANNTRKHYKQDKVFTCGILNAKSGKCSENCAFCAQSGHNRARIENYPLMSKQEIVEHGLQYAEAGSSNFSIVISGLGPGQRELDIVCEAVQEIKSRTNLATCASLGTLTPDMAQSLRQAGLTNYHHNLETAPSYFANICTTHAVDEDIQTLQTVQDSGLRICSGGIMGLGESWQQRVELALTLQELNVDSIPLNFLNPIPGTPLQDNPILGALDALKCIAVYRLINRDKDIVVCGGREVTLKDYQSWVFLAGANGLMIGNYLTTQGRSIEADLEMIREFGLNLI
ncbi:MAG: biotin synthase BioB [Thermodesulfobacteriota bacterium]